MFFHMLFPKLFAPRESPPDEIAVLRRRLEQLELSWEDTHRQILNTLRSLAKREKQLYDALEAPQKPEDTSGRGNRPVVQGGIRGLR